MRRPAGLPSTSSPARRPAWPMAGDARPQDESNPAENYRLIREELKRYSPELADKPELVVLNKADLFEEAGERAALAKELARELGLGGKDLLVISGAAREGLRELLE